VEYAIVEIAWGAFGFVVRRGKLIGTFLPAAKQVVKRAIRTRWPDAVENAALMPEFQRSIAAYFCGNSIKFSVEVDVSDFTPFQQSVLESCRRIPYGHTASYADLARAVGKPRASRAVGGTMAVNPLPLVVPCHRVVRSDGSIGGFSSPRGLAEKERLLRLEDALT